MNWHKVTIYLLAAIFLFMLVGAVGTHVFLQRAPLNGVGSASFLFIAGGLVFLAAPKQDRSRLLLIGGIGFACEVIGVKYGWLFGRYEYTKVLAPNLFDVPLVMICAWFILISYVRYLINKLALLTWFDVLLGGIWMTAIDLLLDPIAAYPFGFWIWRAEGQYYGIPWQNFIGWFIVSLVILMVDRLLYGRQWKENRWGQIVGFSILTLYTACSFGYGYILVGSIGMILLVTHILVTRSLPDKSPKIRSECVAD